MGAPGNTDYPEKRNLSGFSALPSGWVYTNGYHNMNYSGEWWRTDGAIIEILNEDSTVRPIYGVSKEIGLSIRCAKDIEP